MPAGELSGGGSAWFLQIQFTFDGLNGIGAATHASRSGKLGDRKRVMRVVREYKYGIMVYGVSVIVVPFRSLKRE